MLLGALISLSLPIPSLAGAADFPNLSHPQVQVLTPEQCRLDYVPQEARPLSFFSAQFDWGRATIGSGASLRKSGPWIPDGLGEYLEPEGCEPEVIEKAMVAGRNSIRQQSKAVKDYFARCGDRLKNLGSRTALADLLFAEYDLCDHPRIRKIVMRFNTGEIVRGFLAVKSGAPRPLIIGKSGVFSNPGDTSQRFMMMHLFDESPFHVLLLANSTGADFVTDNRYVQIGGLNESRHILEAANLMNRTALAKSMSGIHAVSVSLGGHGTLFSSYANSMNPGVDGKPLLKSAFTISPVVDLRAAVDGVFKDEMVSVLGRALFDEVKELVTARDPGLSWLFPDDAIQSEKIPHFMAQKALQAQIERGPKNLLYPFYRWNMKKVADFWRHNNLVPLAAREPFSTPTLVLASQDDLIVRASTNTQKLEEALKAYRAKNPSKPSALEAVTLPYGNHCAFNTVYGWRMFSTLMRSYVLSRSPEMLARRKVSRTALAADAYGQTDFQLAEGEAFYMPKFEFRANQAKILVTQKIYTRVDEDCTGLPVIDRSQGHCFRAASFEIPIDQLAGRPSWVRTPISEGEAASLTRWANANLRIVNADGRSIDGTRELGAGILMVSYD